ncbi:MAG: hypothetical protein RB191_19945 [Terriglobia bacterium]|nr:hypothetical protein [Terriglobia bacterium]
MATQHLIKIGHKYGRLTVLSIFRKKNKNYVSCDCECGKRVEKIAYCVVTGATNSCGCYHRDMCRKNFGTHGEKGTKEYESWANMIQRCTNPKKRSFKDYGERGITVCARWRKFENFLVDMGRAPGRLTLERNDVNGNYEPSNCRWASWAEQNRNKRNTVSLTLNGATKSLNEWSVITGIDYHTLKARRLHGWPDEKILSTPIRRANCSSPISS